MYILLGNNISLNSILFNDNLQLKREDLTLHTTISFVLNILNDSQIVKATITEEYIFKGPITKSKDAVKDKKKAIYFNIVF